MLNTKNPYKYTVYIFWLILWGATMLLVGNIVYYSRLEVETPLRYALIAFANGKYHIYFWPSYLIQYLIWTVAYGFVIAMFYVYQEKYHHDAEGIEQGSTCWEKDSGKYNKTHSEPFGLKNYDDSIGTIKENLNNPKTPPVPGNPNMILSATVRLSTADQITNMNNNVLVVGGAGSGKSRFLIKPNILQMNCSFISIDPAGEMLKSLCNVLKKNGYKIKVFNLINMNHSCKYNPFCYIRNNTDVSIMIDCFMSNTTAPEQKSGDPFWDKSEKALYMAITFYLIDIADKQYQNFATVLWMVQQGQIDENARFTQNSPLDDLFEGKTKISHEYINGRKILRSVQNSEEERKEYKKKIEVSLCSTNYTTFKLGGTKVLKSILISAAVRLNPFSTPEVNALTSDDTVELGQLAKELTCFFVILPQTNTTFNFLSAMLFAQMFETLYYEGSLIPNNRLPYHVRFLLDEFANVGKIPEFSQKISTCRKYNISVTIVLQSIAQLKTAYKDDFDTIIGNCDSSICLGTNEQTSADYFSKKLGKTTIRARSLNGQKAGREGGRYGYQQTGRELMMPEEIQQKMPFQYCIVMMNHTNPFYDKKYDLKNHPLFRETGDGDPKNYYILEDEPEFLCVQDPAIPKEHVPDIENEKGQEESSEMVPDDAGVILEELMTNGDAHEIYRIIYDATSETQGSQNNS